MVWSTPRSNPRPDARADDCHRAEITCLSRAGFIDARAAAKVDAFRIAEAELTQKVEPGLRTYRERLSEREKPPHLLNNR